MKDKERYFVRHHGKDGGVREINYRGDFNQAAQAYLEVTNAFGIDTQPGDNPKGWVEFVVKQGKQETVWTPAQVKEAVDG